MRNRHAWGGADERGTGLIGTLAGFTVMIVLVLFAVQVIFDLYARSMVTATTFDAARRVAAAISTNAASADIAGIQADAEARARASLGPSGREAQFRWDRTTLVGPDPEIVLEVRLTNPSLLPATLTRPFRLDTIDRSVRVRAERPVCPTGSSCGS